MQFLHIDLSSLWIYMLHCHRGGNSFLPTLSSSLRVKSVLRFWHRTYSIVQTPQFASRHEKRMAFLEPVWQTPDSAAGSAARPIVVRILRKDQHHQRGASAPAPPTVPWNSGSEIWSGGLILLFCTRPPSISVDVSSGRLWLLWHSSKPPLDNAPTLGFQTSLRFLKQYYNYY